MTTADPHLDHLFPTAALCTVAGVKPVTFAAWRNRNRLFPETLGPDRTPASRDYWTVTDVCIVRFVVVLTEYGFSASRAIETALSVWAPISMCVQGDKPGWALAVSREPPPAHQGERQPKSVVFVLGSEDITLHEVTNMCGWPVTIFELEPMVSKVIDDLWVWENEHGGTLAPVEDEETTE